MSACSTLLCNNCRAPGRCCFGFALNGGEFGRGMTEIEVRIQLAGHCEVTEAGKREPLPFEPMFRGSGDVWRFWCPKLGRDGRCTDYENRPVTCSSGYAPGQDGLCAMYVPPPPEEPECPS